MSESEAASLRRDTIPHGEACLRLAAEDTRAAPGLSKRCIMTYRLALLAIGR